MSSFASTIVIADWGQPHLVLATLRGLVRNSVHRHKILVVTSDPGQDSDRPGHEGENARARDWQLGADGSLARVLESTADLAEKHAEWLAEHGIEILDVTREALDLRARYRRGEVFPGKTEPQDGVDIAFKNNWGIQKAETEWVFPNWDSDMFPGKGWDRTLVDYASRAGDKESLVPTHVQPHLCEVIPAWRDPWVESRLCNSRLAMPTTRNHPQLGAWSVTEEEWDAFCARMSRAGLIRERAGERIKLHWNPMMVRKRDADAVGRYSYQGAGYDVEFDNALGRAGFTKVSPTDSFILHKGIQLVPES